MIAPCGVQAHELALYHPHKSFVQRHQLGTCDIVFEGLTRAVDLQAEGLYALCH